MTDCPICGATVEIDWEAERGEIVDCVSCGAELEVVGTDPLDFDEAPDIEEDWGE